MTDPLVVRLTNHAPPRTSDVAKPIPLLSPLRESEHQHQPNFDFNKFVFVSTHSDDRLRFAMEGRIFTMVAFQHCPVSQGALRSLGSSRTFHALHGSSTVD